MASVVKADNRVSFKLFMGGLQWMIDSVSLATNWVEVETDATKLVFVAFNPRRCAADAAQKKGLHSHATHDFTSQSPN